jgi:hypothetical protein
LRDQKNRKNKKGAFHDVNIFMVQILQNKKMNASGGYG